MSKLPKNKQDEISNAEHKRHSRERQAYFVCCLIGLIVGIKKKEIKIKIPSKIKPENEVQYFQIMKFDTNEYKERKVRSEEESKIIREITNEITKNISIDKMKKTYCQPKRARFVRYDYIEPFTDEKNFYEFGKKICELIKQNIANRNRNELFNVFEHLHQ